MTTILSYFMLLAFLSGSVYILGLMYFILLTQNKGKVKPLDPTKKLRSNLPKAA